MIDVENKVYTYISDYLDNNYGIISKSSEYSNTPQSFPHISIVEEDNYIYENGIDSADNENYARLTYEIDIYSNKANGRKEETKQIASVVDEAFSKIGFIRIVKTYVSDSRVFRLILRYQAISPKDNTDLTFYRR